METSPVFVDGIGPPLQQIAQDARDTLNGAWTGWQRDVLALIAEVARLHEDVKDEAFMAQQSVETLRYLHKNWREIIEEEIEGEPLIENLLYWLIEDLSPGG